MLENLKELVAINSYENCDKIIDYLKNKFSILSEEIMIVENKGDIIILIMANNKVASKLQTNFQKLK